MRSSPTYFLNLVFPIDQVTDTYCRLFGVADKLQQLVLENSKTEREYLDNLRSIGDIQAQLQELQTKEKRLAQENLESKNQRSKEIQEVSR